VAARSLPYASPSDAPARSPLVSNTIGLLGFETRDRASLKRILEQVENPVFPHRKFKFHSEASVDATLEDCRNSPIPVVLCDRDQTAESWKELLASFAELPDPPLLIVASRTADEHLWAEALNLGAYDVLLKPFDGAEVSRIAGLACMRWYQRHIPLPLSNRAVA
jgi:DNA-binding response OmpR family regulator